MPKKFRKEEPSRGLGPYVVRLNRSEAEVPALTPQEVEKVVLETLQICPDVERVAKRLFAIPAELLALNQELSQAELRHLCQDEPDLPLIARYGYYTQVLELVTALRTAADTFLADQTKTPTHPSISKRYAKPEKFQQYARRYANFKILTDLLVRKAEGQLAAWMRLVIPHDALADHNPYAQIIDQRRGLGEVLVLASKQLAKRSEEPLQSQEIADLLELLSVRVKQESLATRPTIELSETIDQEHLAKVFFDLVAAYRYQLPAEVEAQLPRRVRESFKRGYPLYELIYNLIQTLPSNLVSYDHPGHMIAARLISDLNKFQLSQDHPVTAQHEQMFNYLFCASLIQREYSGQLSYQDFVIKLQGLVERREENEAWYQAILEYMQQGAMHFPRKVIVEAERLHQEVFDVQSHLPITFDLADRLHQILDAGEFEVMQIEVTDRLLPASATALRAEKFETILHCARVSAEFLTVDMVVCLIHPKPEVDYLGMAEDMVRFSCRIVFDDVQQAVSFPVLDPEKVHPELRRMVLEHIFRVLKLIDVAEFRQHALAQAAAEREMNQQKGNGRSGSKTSSSPKPGDRATRMKEYQDRRAEQQSRQPVGAEVPIVSKSQDARLDTTLPIPEVNKFLPIGLLLSAKLELEATRLGKKGARAQVMAQTLDFIRRYNDAAEKPGKGETMTAVKGPNGEKVWRFVVNYDIRCIVVDIGQNRGLVVATDNRHSVYTDASELRNVVARALEDHLDQS